jgi:hypothetical protein
MHRSLQSQFSGQAVQETDVRHLAPPGGSVLPQQCPQLIILTYLLTTCRRHSAGKETAPPPPYKSRRFITIIWKAQYWILSRVSSIQTTTPYPISLTSVLILSSIYVTVFQVTSSLEVFQLKCCMNFLSLLPVLHVAPISSSFDNPSNII